MSGVGESDHVEVDEQEKQQIKRWLYAVLSMTNETDDTRFEKISSWFEKLCAEKHKRACALDQGCLEVFEIGMIHSDPRVVSCIVRMIGSLMSYEDGFTSSICCKNVIQHLVGCTAVRADPIAKDSAFQALRDIASHEVGRDWMLSLDLWSMFNSSFGYENMYVRSHAVQCLSKLLQHQECVASLEKMGINKMISSGFDSDAPFEFQGSIMELISELSQTPNGRQFIVSQFLLPRCISCLVRQDPTFQRKLCEAVSQAVANGILNDSESNLSAKVFSAAQTLINSPNLHHQITGMYFCPALLSFQTESEANILRQKDLFLSICDSYEEMSQKTDRPSTREAQLLCEIVQSLSSFISPETIEFVQQDTEFFKTLSSSLSKTHYQAKIKKSTLSVFDKLGKFLRMLSLSPRGGERYKLSSLPLNLLTELKNCENLQVKLRAFETLKTWCCQTEITELFEQHSEFSSEFLTLVHSSNGLCSSSWEIRDAILKVLTSLFRVCSNNKHLDFFEKLISEINISEFINGTVKEQNHFVQESMLKFLKVISQCYPDLFNIIRPILGACCNKLVSLLKHTQPSTRSATTLLLSEWASIPDVSSAIVSSLLSDRFQCIVSICDDIDWEVKRDATKFICSLIKLLVLDCDLGDSTSHSGNRLHKRRKLQQPLCGQNVEMKSCVTCQVFCYFDLPHTVRQMLYKDTDRLVRLEMCNQILEIQSDYKSRTHENCLECEKSRRDICGLIFGTNCSTLLEENSLISIYGPHSDFPASKCMESTPDCY